MLFFACAGEIERNIAPFTSSSVQWLLLYTSSLNIPHK